MGNQSKRQPPRRRPSLEAVPEMPEVPEDLEQGHVQIDIKEVMEEMSHRLGLCHSQMAQDAVVIKKLSQELLAARNERDELLKRLDALESEIIQKQVKG